MSPGPDLMTLAAELAEELGDTRAAGDGGVVSYRRGQTIFARVSADALEVRLPGDIAQAAAGTPDVVLIPGEIGWVRFAPRGSERHAIDRATAWFQTAWRHAGRPPGTPGASRLD